MSLHQQLSLRFAFFNDIRGKSIGDAVFLDLRELSLFQIMVRQIDAVLDLRLVFWKTKMGILRGWVLVLHVIYLLINLQIKCLISGK